MPAVALAVLLLLTACGEGDAPATSAAGQAPGTEQQTAGSGQSLVYTSFTDSTELFVEFPPLVVEESSTFAAHVTRLDDYAPLEQGRLDVVLEQQGQPVARFRVNAPARSGIFMPSVTPRESGQFRLAIEVSTPSVSARHELGMVTVYRNRGEVQVNQPTPAGGITYLKEQQWTGEFATTVVEQRELRRSVPGFATVQAPADAGARVRAPADGYFAGKGLAVAGDRVDSGDVLGYLTPRLGEGEDMGSLRVAVQRARSRLTLAEQDVERLAPLVEEGAVPRRRLLEAREEREVARAELDAARSRLEQYRSSNEQAGLALRTPVSGEVVESRVRPGTFVRAGDTVFRVVDRQRRWLEVQVPERFARDMGDATGAWLDRGDGEAMVLDASTGARVVHSQLAIDPRKRTASITIEYNSDSGPGLLGERLSAHVFTDATTSGPVVPRSAIIDEGGRRVVYVQTGGETFASRPVEPGIVEGDYVEVASGLSAGERVVSRGAYYVRLAATGNEQIGHGHTH